MKYVFACGGTGGHIFPALATAYEIKEKDPASEVYFFSGKKDVENIIFSHQAYKNTVYSIDSAPYRGPKSFLSYSFVSKLVKGFTESYFLLKKIKPNLVVGFGGYVSFPAIVAAKFLRIPTALHEQNAVPGRANRVLARLTKRVALTYEESARFFSKQTKFSTTGNPIRKEIEMDCYVEALNFFGFDSQKTTLLVLGGSQGAESVNQLLLSALAFLPADVKNNLQLLHLCGKMAPEQAQVAAFNEGVPSRAFSFFSRMELAYGVADLCIGRAGATFLAEIAVKKIPAILIPYPFGDKHQYQNAALFSKNHSALVLDQNTLTPKLLAESLLKVYSEAREHRKRPRLESKDVAREKLISYLKECAK